jgi:hypothetical protein
MTKQQRRARGLDHPAPPSPAGRLPWKARDVMRQHEDGSTELLRWSIIDADGNEIIADFEREDLRTQVLNSVNLLRSAGATPLTADEAYREPMSILRDAVEILPVALVSRERDIDDKDGILRDLIKRIKKVVKHD